MIDPSTLSEEELREKVSQIQARLFSANAMGMSNEIRNQLEMLLDLFELELQTRWAQSVQKMWDDQFPDIIETEPDFSNAAGVQPKKTDAPKEKEQKPEISSSIPKFKKVYRNK